MYSYFVLGTFVFYATQLHVSDAGYIFYGKYLSAHTVIFVDGDSSLYSLLFSLRSNFFVVNQRGGDSRPTDADIKHVYPGVMSCFTTWLAESR
ncbi:hypothetical protein BDY19DRAFT_977009, partial [Irpex rosettiformis]